MTPRLVLRVLAIGVVALAANGCAGDPEQHDFIELGLEVSNALGVEGSVACEPLPVLPGSHRYTEHVIDGRFTVTVFTSPDDAHVSFREGLRPLVGERVITREALEAGFVETIPLLLGSGTSYSVTLTSECTP
jgi:hypothetical protein